MENMMCENIFVFVFSTVIETKPSPQLLSPFKSPDSAANERINKF